MPSVQTDNTLRIYDCDLHLDIINGKVWVQQNMTEMQIGQASTRS
jgi:hypothetical protein